MEKREYDDKIYHQEITESGGITCVKEHLADACFMSYMAGTTGLRGGNAGYGGRAVVTLRFEDGSNIFASASDVGFGKGAMERHPETVEGDYDPEGKGVSIVAEGDGEILLLVTALERCANILKKQISARTDLDDGVNYATGYSWYRNKRKKRKATNTKVIEQKQTEPDTEEEDPEKIQWDILRMVDEAHARSYGKLTEQEEVKDGSNK